VNGEAAARRIVVADTWVLINFLKIDRLDLLCEHSGYRILITEHVRDEVTRPEEVAVLEAGLEAGIMDEVELREMPAQELFAELNRVLGRGEAAAIAMAAVEGHAVALDEKGRARREARDRLGEGRLLTTPGVLLRCIELRVLTVDEADEIKDELAGRRFKIAFDSFGDLASPDDR